MGFWGGQSLHSCPSRAQGGAGRAWGGGFIRDGCTCSVDTRMRDFTQGQESLKQNQQNNKEIISPGERSSLKGRPRAEGGKRAAALQLFRGVGLSLRGGGRAGG